MHGLPEAEIEETTQPNPIKPPVADNSAVLAVVPYVPENVSATLIATLPHPRRSQLPVSPSLLHQQMSQPILPPL